MATKVPNGLDLQTTKIINLATPTSGTDAVNKTYVDGLASGALIDGGSPSTVTAGNLRIDFGSPT